MAFATGKQGHIDFEQTIDVVTEAYIQGLGLVAGCHGYVKGVDENVVPHTRSLTLIDRYADHCLLGMGGEKSLHPRGRDDGVTLDDRREGATDIFTTTGRNAQCVRADISQNKFFNCTVPSLARSLSSGTKRNNRVRVKVAVG